MVLEEKKMLLEEKVAKESIERTLKIQNKALSMSLGQMQSEKSQRGEVSTMVSSGVKLSSYLLKLLSEPVNKFTFQDIHNLGLFKCEKLKGKYKNQTNIN